MIRYMIVDDESIAHDIIKDYGDLLNGMEFKVSCYDAIEALDYLHKESVDLIFLDLNMPKLSGFQFLRTLTSPPKVIVTTAYSEHALESYELEVVDYLLKPFSFERFLKAIEKVKSLDKVPVVNNSISQGKSETIFLKSNKKFIQIPIHDILYLESSGNYVKVFTSNDCILVRDKISEILKNLPANEFYRVHKSFAIARSRINMIEGNRIFINEHEIPIGKSYRNELMRTLE